jgi:hypothetical protein
MARQEPAPIAQWQRHVTRQQQVGDRCPVAHTTTLHPAEEHLSSCDRVAKRCQVAPLVSFIEGMCSIGRCIRGIDLCRAISSDQRAEGLIDELGVTRGRTPSSGILEETFIDSCADPNTSHGMNVASSCHTCAAHLRVSGVSNSHNRCRAGSSSVSPRPGSARSRHGMRPGDQRRPGTLHNPSGQRCAHRQWLRLPARFRLPRPLQFTRRLGVRTPVFGYLDPTVSESGHRPRAQRRSRWSCCRRRRRPSTTRSCHRS